MKITGFLAALTVIVAPSVASAMGGCSGYDHKVDTASSCVDGTQWDTALEACVPVVTS